VLMLSYLQVCVQLCEVYKQQYMVERDAVRVKSPEKVSARSLLAACLLACCQTWFTWLVLGSCVRYNA
jgi:hypothetical protein